MQIMKKLFVLVIGALIWVGSASAQPVIRAENGVLNTSSYLPDIARGSWFVVFGTGMGPASISQYSGGLPYPTELSGTRVTFTPASGGAAVEARMWYTSMATQLGALLPSSTAAGDYDVRVIYNSQPSAPRRVKVVERNFGFATQTANGAGPAQATYGGADLNRFTTGTVGTWAVRPAKAGDRIDLWGTGLGPDLSSDLTGATSGDQAAAAQVRVVVGGTEIAPLYAGRSSGSPGLDQIVFTLPAGVAAGCTVSLQVRAGGKTSNLGSLAIANAGQQTCTHPSLTAAQLTKLDQGGTLTYGDFTLSGVGKAASEAGAEVVLPKPHLFQRTTLANGKLIRNWPIFFGPFEQADKLIGIAPVKHHHRAGASMSMKNWYGLLGGRRNIFHQDINTIIAELSMMVKPTLVILDGTEVMMTNGPTGGSVSDLRRANTLIASTDCVAADSYGATLLDLKVSDLPYLAQAEKAGAGTTDYESLKPARATIG